MNAHAPPRPTHSPALAGSATDAIAERPPSIHDHRLATRKMRNWYESLADYMIVHPTISNGELARHFGRAESTISTVVNTDSFKAYFRQRRAQHESTLDAQVRQKLFRIADNSLDTMLAVLEKKKDSVPIESLQRMSDMALKNLGYGAGPASPVQVNVNNSPPQVSIAVSLDDLERAREALRRNQLSAPLDGEYTIVENASEASGASPSTDETGEAEPKARLEDLA